MNALRAYSAATAFSAVLAICFMAMVPVGERAAQILIVYATGLTIFTLGREFRA